MSRRPLTWEEFVDRHPELGQRGRRRGGDQRRRAPQRPPPPPSQASQQVVYQPVPTAPPPPTTMVVYQPAPTPVPQTYYPPAPAAPPPPPAPVLVDPASVEGAPRRWGPLTQLGPNLRIRAAEGFRAVMIPLGPGIHIVQEVPEAHVSGFGSLLLTPLLVKKAGNALLATPSGQPSMLERATSQIKETLKTPQQEALPPELEVEVEGARPSFLGALFGWG